MPLVWAIILDNQENIEERLEFWLANGADANADFRLDKEIQVFNGNGAIKRIKPEYKSQKPVEYAEKNKMFDVVQLLQKYGAKPKYEVTNLHWCKDRYSKWVCGTFINNTESKLGMVYISFNLYDSDNARIGEANAVVNNLNPKEKWKFEATGGSGDVQSYKLGEISIHDL